MPILAFLLTAAAFAVLGSHAPTVEVVIESRSAGLLDPFDLQPHEPIHITADAGFNASNGVRSGSGSPEDPYLISDWLFDAALYPNSSAMIWLENTDEHVIVENCQVVHFDTVRRHYQAFYLGKYPGENRSPTIAPPTIDLTSNVTFLNNDIDSRYGYGIQIAEGSSNILVHGNRVNVHPDNVSGKNWTYGINAARNTHNVTIENNLVIAASPRYITIGIHLSDYYVSEQRRASQLVARNNTVIDAQGGIHVESSRFTLVRDNVVYQTQLNSLAYGWPRAITVRESALNASLIHNTIHRELTGIVIAASTDNWGIFGPITSADNVTLRDNSISDVDTGISIGNVTGTHIVNTTFTRIAFQELNLNGEGGPPRDLTLTNLASPIRIRAPSGAVPIRWTWTDLAPAAEYYLTGTNETTTLNTPFMTTSAGLGSVVLSQPLTKLSEVMSYVLVGPMPASNGGNDVSTDNRIPYFLTIAVLASIGLVIVIDMIVGVVDRSRHKDRRTG